MVCVETIDLSHRYGDDKAILSGIDLQVPEGSIYGFLGPNGAGKTTTLRLLLGLMRKQHGEIRVFGHSLATHRRSILARTGALIESPSLYDHLSAVDNLAIPATVLGVSRARIATVLERVGLAATGSKRVAHFSLGMKQRLGIAVALLHQPSLLILDEPTNGLDPNGIIEIRELLIALNREAGTTILVSSHLLGEIERLVSHVGILHQGILLRQGTLAALRDEHESVAPVLLRSNDDAAALAMLRGWDIDARIHDNAITMPAMPPARIAQVNHRLVAAGLSVHAIGQATVDLEGIFMDLIGVCR